MDPVTQLQTAQANLIAAIVTATANPRPNVSVDGESVSYGEYLRMLSDALKAVQELLTYFDPVELRSQVL